MINYWPIRPQIQPDELLTSWIKRISSRYANFLAEIMNVENLHSIHYDYIDLDPGDDLLVHLSKNTLIPINLLKEHSFQSFSNNFPALRKQVKNDYRILKYPLTNPQFLLKFYSNSSKISNIRYCPLCLAEEIPYFRLYWRFGYYTACIKHQILMHNTCPECNKPIQYFNTKVLINECQACKTDLSLAPQFPIKIDAIQIFHDAFWKKLSPIQNLTSQKFLYYFWKTFVQIINRNDNYVNKILAKYGYNYNIENSLVLNHNILNIVWKLFQEDNSDPEKLLPCLECNSTFKKSSELEAHIEYKHLTPSYRCKKCNEYYPTKTSLRIHKEEHINGKHQCNFCSSFFTTLSRLSKHKIRAHKAQLTKKINDIMKNLEQQGEKITFGKISRIGKFSTTVFEKHPEFHDIVKNFIRNSMSKIQIEFLDSKDLHNTLKNIVQKNIIKKVIQELIQKDIAPTQRSVSKKLGVSTRLFRENISFKEILEKDKTNYKRRKLQK
ncbi:MAG: TniQ family protein [Promethearchaeota archaeon]